MGFMLECAMFDQFILDYGIELCFFFMLALSASFQRTDSNKDGVMLLGVSKTPSGEENVIGFDGK